MKKDDGVYLKHMLDSILRIEKFTNDMKAGDFSDDELVQSAVIRELEIIGEATKKLSAPFRDEHKGIPWRTMAGMRDKLIHDYLGVDIDAVWNTVETDIPPLKKALSKILR